jgi:uncharacterized membrane protein
MAKTNVGKYERAASGAAGGLFLLLGLRKRGFFGFLMAALGGLLVYRGATGNSFLYQALDINTAGDEAATGSSVEYKSIFVEDSVNINKPAQELYAFWRNFENLPRIMSHLEQVKILDERTSHWVAKAPLGMNVEWDAELVYDKPGERIGWRSKAGADVDNAGSVHFESLPDGSTRVNVALSYRPPAGALGAAVAKLLGEEPSVQIADDLQRFKRSMEGSSSAMGLSGTPATA